MNDKYIAQAATQEEAIQQGLDALGITRDEAKITVEEPGKKGFLGIGQKDAVIVVERKEKVNMFENLLNDELNIDREQSETIFLEETDQEEEIEKTTLPAGEEEPEETKAPTKAVTEISEGQTSAEAETSTEDEKAADNEKIAAGSEASEELEVAAVETETTIVQNDQEAIESVRQYLADVIQAMNIPDVEVYTSRVDSNVKYDIETENAGLVIGRHGKVLNGLQTLAQSHMHQLAHSKINVRVDAEKYRERRRNTVENLAERTADKVIKTNQRVNLEPMPAHERKQIHRYLNQNPRVKTHSEGREPNRYLVVEPADS